MEPIASLSKESNMGLLVPSKKTPSILRADINTTNTYNKRNSNVWSTIFWEAKDTINRSLRINLFLELARGSIDFLRETNSHRRHIGYKWIKAGHLLRPIHFCGKSKEKKKFPKRSNKLASQNLLTNSMKRIH